MSDKELLAAIKPFMERICETTGEIITEYHWREAAAISAMIDDNLSEED